MPAQRLVDPSVSSDSILDSAIALFQSVIGVRGITVFALVLKVTNIKESSLDRLCTTILSPCLQMSKMDNLYFSEDVTSPDESAQESIDPDTSTTQQMLVGTRFLGPGEGGVIDILRLFSVRDVEIQSSEEELPMFGFC